MEEITHNIIKKSQNNIYFQLLEDPNSNNHLQIKILEINEVKQDKELFGIIPKKFVKYFMLYKNKKFKKNSYHYGYLLQNSIPEMNIFYANKCYEIVS